MHPIPDIGGFRGICNGFSVRIIVYCWKYFWWKLQCIVGKAVVVLGRIQCISSKNYFVLFEVFLVETMIWRDHVSIMAHNRRRGWQHFEKITGKAIAETVIFQNFTLGADYERHNWKHYLARICFMSYGIPTFVSSLEMIENFGIHWEGSSRLFDLCGGPSVGLEIFGKNWNFCFFLEMLMILKISRFWKIIISKEEGQLWRWEGYIGGNCNVSHFREWWFLRKMQCISGQNYCVLLEKFLVQIAMHRWPGSGGFGPFSASELLNLLLLLLLWPFQIFLLIFKPNIS